MMGSVFSRARASRGILVLTACAAFPLAALAQPQGRTSSPAKTPGAASRSAPPAAAAAPAAAAGAAAPTAQSDQFADGIAAVVNKDVITMREVNEGVKEATQELSRQNIQLPDPKVLQRQVLQRLIMENLERQEAARLNIRVDDAQVDQAIASIAERNRISVEQMRREIEKQGLPWSVYRRSIRSEILSDRLRQRVVDSTLLVSDAEVDAFLKEQRRRQAGGSPAGAPAQTRAAPSAPAAEPAQSGPQIVSLAQILVRVPESATRDQVEALRKKAEDILARLKGGADFASVAAAASDGPEALQGGVMGTRPLEGWPDLFVNAIANVPKGGVSGVIQSGNGFHILKVVDRRSAGAPAPGRNPAQTPAQPPAPPAEAAGPGSDGTVRLPQGPVQVTQTHARHILIKTSAVMSDDQARQRLELIRQRIVEGKEDFGALARQNSQDASAPQGGDLGWLNPGETVPEFEQAMNALQPGEVSQPVHSRFGWHLIQVIERREKDVKDELERLQARRVLFERRAQLAFDDWLEQLRGQAYIDNRLEKQARQDSNP
ncbi:molecular chaperone SurA [Bordetella genomosp. 9]|uniref:peptidylprolyl isomerase n=1 Tax=Bordetella genomosp. 9 TaxID=1416803 RepID=UPI000A28DF93|nr:peptidylprolyl isomerase [Bordetella genomosp. 9]ARP91583.1 molecular chaperone SurA [Bordetella genomosp. 9]